VRERWSDTKVLLTSGYAEEVANAERLAAQRVRLLRKPYRLVALAQAIRTALVEE